MPRDQPVNLGFGTDAERTLTPPTLVGNMILQM